MSTEFLSPQELQDTLRKKSVKEPKPASFIVALVKQSDTSDTLLVSQTGCTEWIELPMKMVAKIKLVGKADCGSERYPVALIFLAATDDPFARVAYKLLEQLGTATRGGRGAGGGQGSGGCGCKEGSDPAPGRSARARNVDIGGLGGLGQFGISGGCTFHFVCYPCTRCIPWTDICWSSTCCDLVGVDCDIGW